MSTRIFAVVLALLGCASPALAAENWLVTEENVAGVKGAQGSWSVDNKGGKLTGKADMMSGRGAPLSYRIEGSVADGVYTVTLSDRTDGKQNCVWSGHVPSSSSSQKQGLIGYAECGDARLIIRASPAPQ